MAMTSAERSRNWRERNPGYNERFAEQQQAWRKNNPDRIRESARRTKIRRHHDRKLELIIRKGGKCERCGFDHPGALQFHHRDPSTKLFEISVRILARLGSKTWDDVLAEIDKCDLLCSNCHDLEHFGATWEGE